jgi:hypothetical protein
MKQNILLLYFICASLLVDAQIMPPLRPYEQLHYDNWAPQCYNTHFDMFQQVDSRDGYNNYREYYYDQPNYVIEGDFIYQFFLIGGREDPTGTYLQKTNIKTGNIVWKRSYGLTNFGLQEMAALMFINKSGYLEILSQIKREHYGNHYSLDSLIYSVRLYNKETGALLQITRPELEDTSAFTGIMSRYHYYNRKLEKYHRFDKKPKNGKLNYELATFDSRLNTWDLSLRYLPISKIFSISRPFQLDDQSFILTETDDKTNQVFLRFVDDTLHVTKEILTESMGFPNFRTYLWDFNKEDSSFLFYNFLPDFDNPFEPDKNIITIMDKHGKVTKSFVVPQLTHFLGYEVLDWRQGLTVMSYNITVEPETKVVIYLDILKEKGDTLEIFTHYVPQDSLRHPGVFRAIPLENNDYLLT